MNAHTPRPMSRRRNLAALTALVSLSLVAVCGLSYSAAQGPEKGGREVAYKIPKHLPIKVKVRRPERLKEAGNEDWLGELELEVTNTGPKPIYYLHISVYLPDVFAPNGRNFGYGFEYGRTKLIALDEPVLPEDAPIQPGGVITLKVPAEQAELWKRGRAKGDRTNPRRLEFIFNYLNFGDGTGFVGSDGVPIPDTRERGSNATCPGADNAGEAASVADWPRSYFPDVASLAAYIPQPARLVSAFFFGNLALPAPATRQDLCCTSPCSRLKTATDQGCECPGVQRRIVQPTSCSDPTGSCGTIRYEGGNGDGVVDGADAVFPSLRLWRDANHDGVSQPSELHTLQSRDVVRLRLDYKESKRADGYGNRFRYRAKVDDAKGTKAGRWAWDVFLVAGR